MVTIQCIDNSGLAFEVSPDGLCPGFSECGSYFFVITELDSHLFIDDVALSRVSHEDRPAWHWEPGFFAGEVSAELTNASGDLVASYRLDVSPQSSKLGRESFSQMIEDILAFDPRLLMGTEYAQIHIGVDGNVSNLHLQYARLRRYSAALISALRGVTEKPLTLLRRERSLQSPNQVKRLDRRSVLRAMRNSTALSILRGQPSEFSADNPILFDVSSVFNDLDNPANQALAVVLKEVIRRTRLVTLAMQTLSEKEESESARSALGPRLGRRIKFLQSLHHDLRRIERCEPFVSLKSPQVSAAGLNVISAHPIYARAYRYGWYVLRAGIFGEHDNEQLWISPTWEIYERWCYLKVVDIVRQCYPQLKLTSAYPTSREDCIRFSGRLRELKVDVWLQVSCPAFDQKPYQGFASISGQRYPDIAITLDTGEQTRFLIVDAKYRTSRKGVLDGMQSAHLYRDSLRWFGKRPDCALLLIPKKGGAAALETREYRQANGVGVIALAVGEDMAELGDVLGELLNVTFEQNLSEVRVLTQ